MNRCVTASFSEDAGAPEAMVPFSVDPILLELKGGKYVKLLLLAALLELVSGRCDGGIGGSGGGREIIRDNGGSSGGGGGRSGSGSRSVGRRRGGGWSGAVTSTGGAGGAARVWACYEAHLPALYLQYG